MLNRNENGALATTQNNKKRILLILSLVLAICIIASVSVYAAINYAKANASEVKDTFEPATVSCTVTANGTTYTVTNTSNIPVFVRVLIDPSWVDSSGNVHWTEPTYTVDDLTGWTEDGDYYYYNTAVAAGDSVSITVVPGSEEAPSGFELKVNVAAEVIQSEPTDAAQEAWKYVPSN